MTQLTLYLAIMLIVRISFWNFCFQNIFNDWQHCNGKLWLLTNWIAVRVSRKEAEFVHNSALAEKGMVITTQKWSDNHATLHSRARARFIFKRMYPRDQLFCDKTRVQTINNGLNDTIGIKKNEVVLALYSFTPFDMNFQTILMPKVILAKILSQINYSPRPFLS